MNTDELLLIKENIINKTDSFTQDLNKAEYLKNEMGVLKNNLSQELAKTNQSVDKLSSIVNQSAKSISQALSQKSEQINFNLSDDSVEELTIAVRNLEKLLETKKAYPLQNYIYHFLVNGFSFLLVMYLLGYVR